MRGFDALFKPGGFDAGSEPVRNEFGQDIRLYLLSALQSLAGCLPFHFDLIFILGYMN
jgi:hypothetical protein